MKKARPARFLAPASDKARGYNTCRPSSAFFTNVGLIRMYMELTDAFCAGYASCSTPAIGVISQFSQPGAAGLHEQDKQARGEE